MQVLEYTENCNISYPSLIKKSNNSTEALSSYLKKFTKLRKSLLLEIDPFEQKFVAKSFSEDHSVVRYSALTFSDANFEVVSCDEMSYKQRIKLGMTVNLDKFIKIIDRFDFNNLLSKKSLYFNNCYIAHLFSYILTGKQLQNNILLLIRHNSQLIRTLFKKIRTYILKGIIIQNKTMSQY